MTVIDGKIDGHCVAAPVLVTAFIFQGHAWPSPSLSHALPDSMGHQCRILLALTFSPQAPATRYRLKNQKKNSKTNNFTIVTY